MTVDGREITHLPPENRNFGLVFQGYALFPHLTVWENVFYPLRVRGMSKSAAASKVSDVLDLIQLSQLSERYPKQLSGGQQQRVALARALVFSPELLLLDEPLSALDRALRKDLQRELKDLHERVGTTFIYVTHDQEEALSMSDRIAILRDGQIEQLGTPSELYENPASIFVANFLGKSNFIPVQNLRVEGKDVGYQVGQEQFRLSQDGKQLPQADELSLALRPERLALYSNREDAPENCLVGRVEKVTYFGQLYEAIVATESAGDLLVTVDLAHSKPSVGEQVWIGWEVDSGVILAGRPVEADDAYAG